MKTVELDCYFAPDKIFGVNAHQQHGVKAEALRSYVQDKLFEELIIVGDSLSDMELAEVCGGVTYYYTHPKLESRGEANADYGIGDLRKVLVEL